MRHRLLAGAAWLGLLAATSLACLWDSDTLRAESGAVPGVLEVLTGRFDRLPDRYYQRRIEIAEQRLADDPGALGAYDDIAVAHDRLGDADAAIAWMTRKRAALDEAPAPADGPDHEYRYLANLGTFHTHRWLRAAPAARDRADLLRAQSLIAAAIERNPEAHFGRERYQLEAIEWLLDPVPAEEDLGWVDAPLFWVAPSSEAIEGLAGLIRLGAAWQSVDITLALGRVLRDAPTTEPYLGHSSLAYVAMLRVHELAEAGRRPLLWPAGTPGFPEDLHLLDRVPIDERPGRRIEAWYADARAEADAWVAARNAYVEARLDEGLHPDTHGEVFWAAWREASSPPPPPDDISGWSERRIRAVLGRWIFGGVAIVAVLLAAAIVVARRAARRRRPPVPATG